jgi:CDP-diacylglycerol--serine O-phosphatidyltransferase
MRFIGFYDYTVILTYVSVISAVMGMVCAHKGAFGAAMLCLFASGFCDAFDGTVARSKKNRTEDEKAFGIQLDSLCDVVSFGAAPAFACYCMGMDGIAGLVILCLYCICAVIRLAFFNVQEAKRQQTEDGCNKFYRGLPVTTSSMIFPLYYLLRPVMSGNVFVIALHGLCALTAFLFVLDFRVKKPDLSKMISVK